MYNVFPTCFLYIMLLIFKTTNSQFSNYVHLLLGVFFGEMTPYFSECLIKLTKKSVIVSQK